MLRKIVLLAAAAALASAQKLDGFDAFAAQALRDWKCDGFAIAVIQDGKVILSKGYGLRNVKKNLPVTEKTLFAIGSATKSFTVTSLGVLVDQGKLEWDKPVRDYLPGFKMWDPVATERMTARDLVTHRSGLPRHDLMWYNSPFSREELFERLRYLEPNKDFRTTFQYQNLMFMTAGYLAGHVAGTTWEQLVQKTIFEPLGMTGSNFSVIESQKSADFSLPYKVANNIVVDVPFRNLDSIGPAGSINSNLEDMTKYVMMHLEKGRGVLSATNEMQMMVPQMAIQAPSPDKELGDLAYGMGFFVTSYRGHKFVHHGGNIDGFSSLVAFLPQENIGLVILTNQDASALPAVVAYNIWDRLLGLDQIDWTTRVQRQIAMTKASELAAKQKGYTTQRTGTHPSHDLAEYAGEYEHPGYGIVKIEQAGGALKLDYHGLGGALTHFHYDVFEVPKNELNPFSEEKVQFHTNLAGEIDSLGIPFESTLKDITFVRRGDRNMMERTFLTPLAGEYQRGPMLAVVALKGDTALTLTLPGQPVYNLVPVRGTKFNIKELNGYSVEFKGDDLVFYQPSGTFSASRKK
ncbi:MAG: serine hydrolase [Bryobacteraceae bacterium]|jgi:CubicO group peptidase (beta-lactamase class C family)